MLHFFWTPYVFEQDSYKKYEYSNLEIVKYARRNFEAKVPTHIADLSSSRVTDRADDILLGHPTWGTTTNNWVKDNALTPQADCHPNTYIFMPWLPVFPKEFIMPHLEHQLLAARKIFTICGDYWIQKTIELTDDSIQSRVKNKLIQGNMGCNAKLLPYKKSFKRSSRKNILHMSNFTSIKDIPLLFNSLEGLDTTLCIGSQVLEGKKGNQACVVKDEAGGDKSHNFWSLGFAANNDHKLNNFIIDKCGFYIHTSSYDAQATTILENCARGLVPLITPESGFTCPQAIYLTRDAEENKEIISKALGMSDDEFATRSQGVRQHIIEYHNWKAVFANIWSGIQEDQQIVVGQSTNAYETDSESIALFLAANEDTVDNIDTVIEKVEHYIEGEEWIEAEVKLLKALVEMSENPRLNSMLGIVYTKLGFQEKALHYQDKVKQLLPNTPDSYYELAMKAKMVGERNLIEEHLMEVLALEPDHYNALNSLGVLFSEQGKRERAEKLFFLAMASNAEIAAAHINLAGDYKIKGLFSKATSHLEKALTLEPKKSSILNNLGNLLLETCHQKKALELYHKAMQLNENDKVAYDNYLFTMHYEEDLSSETIYKEHRKWAKICCKSLDENSTFSNLRLKERRLRVGYISGDFRTHSVGDFIGPIISGHRKEEVELFAYYNNIIVDSVTLKFREQLLFGWRDISTLDDTEAEELIRSDRIDILVDLSGHTPNNRMGLFGRKPAPIQVTYLGYPDTTGLDTVDFRLTDEKVDPEGLCDHFNSEQLVRLPGTFICYQPPAGATDLGHCNGQESGIIVFTSFNNSSKINKRVVKVWAGILNKVPDSCLLLKSGAFGDSAAVEYVLSLFQQYGVEINRIQFRGHLPTRIAHLELYKLVDIGLDPFPYNGTTTTCEALWMGCPVITLVGDRHSARVGFSILSSLGLDECIAYSEQEYIDLAVELALDREKLVCLKKQIRSRLESSALMDNVSFVANLEKAYRAMWHQWCDKTGYEQPATIKVKGDLRITVPDSINLMTPFVLLEQEDWFEIELDFVRKYVQPGMKVIDIGANYGLYTLNMARMVGAEGQVLAFEPSSDTSAYLKMSIRNNNLDNIHLVEAGLSSKRGSAMLSLNANAELNSICRQGDSQENAEHILLLALDECLEQFDIQELDFLKLDAEGEESEIIKGAKKLLQTFSPLLMFELTHGQGHNLDLVSQFKEIGYSSYYLIPGLGLLAPFDESKKPDPYLLNLFACKDDLADQLEQKGFLCKELIQGVEIKPDSSRRDLFWQNKAYVSDLSELWADSGQGENKNRAEYILALEKYMEAQNVSLSAGKRIGLLTDSYISLRDIGETDPTLPHLLSLVRVASEVGERQYTVRLLDILLELFSTSQQIMLDEEHFAVSEQYDTLLPGDKIGEWLLSSIVEQKIKIGRFSSYFDADSSSMEDLESLQKLGFQSPEMERRRQLLLLRDGKIKKVEPSKLLSSKSNDNLNYRWWGREE